jgi:hypothetical protein
MSQEMACTLTPCSARSSVAVACNAASPRAQMVSATPSRASELAQALPRPLLAAQTMACLPRMPRSMLVSRAVRGGILAQRALAAWRQDSGTPTVTVPE